MIVNVIVTQHHRRPPTQISRKPVVLVYCSWFWVVLVGFVGFVGGFGWFCWWFWLVPCFSNYELWFIYLPDRLEDCKLVLVVVNCPILQMWRSFWFLLFEMGLPGGKLNVPYVFRNSRNQNGRRISNRSKALNF